MLSGRRNMLRICQSCGRLDIDYPYLEWRICPKRRRGFHIGVKHSQSTSLGIAELTCWRDHAKTRARKGV